MSKEQYESPLASRYASQYMLHLFSADMRIQTWRRLWVALARAEHNLGLPVTAEQVADMVRSGRITANTIFGIDASTLGGGGAAAVFGAAWFFFRVIRKIIGTLFMLCVVYLVAKTAFGIDIAQYITPLFK